MKLKKKLKVHKHKYYIIYSKKNTTEYYHIITGERQEKFCAINIH